jgi:hypothetical protein
MSLVNRDCLEAFTAGTRCGEWGREGHDPTACPLCKASQQARLSGTVMRQASWRPAATL